jgi:CheY-like chemotaxis protein
LVVEDDALIRMMIIASLEDLHCTVVDTAFNLDNAVRKAQHLHFDVGLLDVNVAGTLVFPVSAILVERHIPFIFATAYSIEIIPTRYRCAPLLAKPFNEVELRDRLCLAMHCTYH